MSQGKMRLGRMASWQRKFSYVFFTLCAFTGLVWYVLADFLNFLPPKLTFWWVTHGLTGLICLILFGAAMPQHIVVAWKSHRNRVGGALATFFIGMLIISTALLYYGPELIRDNVRNTHIVLGLALLVLFPWHIIRGRNSPGKIAGFVKHN